MSSKKEEAKAYERLRKVFPGCNVSLDCRHESWYPKPYYRAYADSSDGVGGSFGQGDTPNEAIDNLIRRKEELKQKMIDEKENAK